MNKKDPSDISAEKLPALRTFLRGYFHQDLADEYGSPQEAAETFCEDADTEERLAVAKDWHKFMELVHGRSTAEINRLLTMKLGSAVQLEDMEIEQISAIFDRYLRPKAHRHNALEEEEE
jgi:hypothetical protein